MLFLNGLIGYRANKHFYFKCIYTRSNHWASYIKNKTYTEKSDNFVLKYIFENKSR